jgi:hypothetical protein
MPPISGRPMADSRRTTPDSARNRLRWPATLWQLPRYRAAEGANPTTCVNMDRTMAFANSATARSELAIMPNTGPAARRKCLLSQCRWSAVAATAAHRPTVHNHGPLTTDNYLSHMPSRQIPAAAASISNCSTGQLPVDAVGLATAAVIKCRYTSGLMVSVNHAATITPAMLHHPDASCSPHLYALRICSRATLVDACPRSYTTSYFDIVVRATLVQAESPTVPVNVQTTEVCAGGNHGTLRLVLQRLRRRRSSPRHCTTTQRLRESLIITV